LWVLSSQVEKKAAELYHHGNFLTTDHLSFMVHWWVVVHCGQTTPSLSKASQETTINGCVKMTENQLFGQETT
jgi:hypothetical protein